MNTLAMGPLPAKQKREVTKEGISRIVFRCGVRDCPEVLGVSNLIKPHENVYLSANYQQSQGIWIKSRRSHSRTGEKFREAANISASEETCSKVCRDISQMDGLLGPFIAATQRIDKNEAFTLLATMPEEEKRARLSRMFRMMANDRSGKLQAPNRSIGKGSALVKCGRCGRISKIEGAG